MESPKPANGVEIADIFRKFASAFRNNHSLPVHILKTMRHIEYCRTAVFGGHIDCCDNCGHMQISYNSCGDRNCPKCGILAKEKWLQARKEELLNVPYYHVVFTLPSELNEPALLNPEKVYNLLFKSAKETLIKLGRDPKHLGADIGLIAVLHTWGQNLCLHPHLHCIVPGGGLSSNSDKWLYPKKSKKNKKFFVHVNVISDLYKKIFLSYFKIEFPDYRKDKKLNRLLNDLYNKKWITYCKKPFGGPQQVLEYIGRYTHRVAITNNRIIKIENGRVFFKWRDYKDGNKIKIMSLDADEFIRRFLMHVLPAGFMKIRYFGILASRNKKHTLSRCRSIKGLKTNRQEDKDDSLTWQDWFFKVTGVDIACCPKCKKGRMLTLETIKPARAAPG